MPAEIFLRGLKRSLAKRVTQPRFPPIGLPHREQLDSVATPYLLRGVVRNAYQAVASLSVIFDVYITLGYCSDPYAKNG